MIRLASVPYVNALPLIWGLEEDPFVDLTFAAPSALPALLDSGAADAVLVSSFDSLTQRGRTVVGGVGIGSDGATGSVRLFSRVPLAEVKRLALDPASLTSNHLGQILLSEITGRVPEQLTGFTSLPEAFAAGADAVIAIGDYGMTAERGQTDMYDLGELWKQATGLPFVWAMWTGSASLGSAVGNRLRLALSEGMDHLDEVSLRAERTIGRECRSYFTDFMQYRFDDRYGAGLREYARRLQAHGIDAGCFPSFV